VLHELSIANLGVIESARIALEPGLTVVTGETGAGKTMVLTGLGLILGSKSIPAAVRAGADEALAEAVLDAPHGSIAHDMLAEAGVLIEDDGSVVIARTVGVTTRSRTVVGGRTVPQALLSEIADHLVTVHGQSDQVRLRSATKQRETLDTYAGAGHQQTLEHYREAWNVWGQAQSALEEMEHGAQASRAEVEQMRQDLLAIDEVDPQPGEDHELTAQAQVLENSETIRIGVVQAHQALGGEGEFTVVAAIETARRALAEAAHHDPTLAELEQRVADFGYGATDVASELTSYLDQVQPDAMRLDHVHERRSQLSGLARRLNTNLEGVLSYRDRARERIAADDAWDVTLAERREQAEQARAAAVDRAAELGRGRRVAASALAEAVNTELSQLAMPDASFQIDISERELSAHGGDQVTMTLSAHPGATPRPVAEAASGGELSRIMLAIEVSLAGAGATPGHTFVFDEVDAGVGGKAAIAVGNRLAALARTHQVLVVTHLAQVASFADHHVVVAKSTDGAVTRAQVREVVGEDRVQEIARLLSGQEDSTTARAHAVELLEASSVAR